MAATATPATKQQDTSESEPSSAPARDLDVVLCHVSADYDTLAGAVGLAKLRGGNTQVVLSGGSNSSVEQYLHLFMPLFPIRTPKSIDAQRIRWVGVVDCSRRDRLGTCVSWTEEAEAVEVYDHHQQPGACDLFNRRGALSVTEEAVGAVTTMIVERLRDAQVHVSAAEATLFALGIHSDTGSFSFENTTSRDANAFAWLVERGANARTVLEFKSATLTDTHRDCLNASLRRLRRRSVRGVVVGTTLIETAEFVKGLSPVAQDVLELSNVDVLLFGVVNELRRRSDDEEPPRRQLSLIARCRAIVQGVELGRVLLAYGGGGHAKAAACTVRTERDPASIFKEIVRAVHDSLPAEKVVGDVMWTEVVSVRAEVSVCASAALMRRHCLFGLPVVGVDGALLGAAAQHELWRAQRDGLGGAPVARYARADAVRVVSSESTLAEAERVLASTQLSSMLAVVDGRGAIVGLLTRRALLSARRLL